MADKEASVQPEALGFAALHERWLSIVTTAKWRLIAVASVLVLSGFAYEWAASTGDLLVLASLLNAILVTICQYWTIRILLLMGDGDWQAPSQPRIVALIMLSIVVSLAILVGLILLILPGLYLAARWIMAGCILVAEDRTIGESIKESWKRTEGFSKLFLVAILVTSVPLLPVLLSWVVIDMRLIDSASPSAIAIFEHVAFAAWSMLLWSISVAAYLLIPKDRFAADAQN